MLIVVIFVIVVVMMTLMEVTVMMAVMVVFDFVRLRNLCEASLGTSARELAELNVCALLLLRAETFPESIEARAK